MSLRTAIQRSANIASRRFASTSAMPKAPVPEVYGKRTVKKAFFSDPSTYPLIAVMCLAGTFIVGFSINGIRNKNVRINPSIKHDTLNPESSERRTSVTEIISRNPIGFHRQSFKDIRHEGLGINHEEWAKAKEHEK